MRLNEAVNLCNKYHLDLVNVVNILIENTPLCKGGSKVLGEAVCVPATKALSYFFRLEGQDVKQHHTYELGFGYRPKNHEFLVVDDEIIVDPAYSQYVKRICELSQPLAEEILVVPYTKLKDKIKFFVGLTKLKNEVVKEFLEDRLFKVWDFKSKIYKIDEITLEDEIDYYTRTFNNKEGREIVEKLVAYLKKRNLLKLF